MNIVTILLGIIAISEITRLLLTHWPVSKKAHYRQKLENTAKMIWDFEFKLFKTREMREAIRKEYDFMQARIDGLNTQITNWPKTKNEGDRKKIEDQKVLAERDAERLLLQIKQLDVENEGTKPTNEYPDGVQGTAQNIESLREVQSMLKDYIKSL